MDCRRIAAQIDRLENEVQHHTNSYMLDADMTSVIDAQLNGHIKALQTYCKLNNLTSFADSINDFFPVDRTAIEFFCLWDNIKTDIIEHSEALQGRERQRIISKIAYELQAYIQDHLSEHITLESLTRQFHYSRSYLTAQFRMTTGMSIMEYISRLRIQRAKELLLDGGMTVAQIAEELGYSSMQYFSQCFKQAVGCSPSRYASTQNPFGR